MTGARDIGQARTCPICSADLRGEQIPQQYLEAGYYGEWQPEDGPRYYERTIGVEVQGVYDGMLFYQCPDCGGRWHRWPVGTRQHAAAIRYVNRLDEGVDTRDEVPYPSWMERGQDAQG